MRLLTMTIVLASATFTVSTGQLVSLAETFPVVSGAGYEGAIIPGSSPWHELGLAGSGRATNASDTARIAWTPKPSDIELTERQLTAFVKLAAKDPLQALATFPEGDRGAVLNGLPWLVPNLRTLKRHYFGIEYGGVRRILVHGFPDDAAQSWRFEGRLMIDGGCGNFWFELNLDRQRVVGFSCGGSA